MCGNFSQTMPNAYYLCIIIIIIIIIIGSGTGVWTQGLTLY
jgi:hypothetical protein